MRIVKLALLKENDIVIARQRARQIASLVGFDRQEQTRIATAVSEIARNALEYANTGTLEFAIEGTTTPQVLMCTVTDQGPGIADLNAILDGRYQSRSGLGIGILGARRLMDQCEIATKPGQGTIVRLKKLLPRSTQLISGKDIDRFIKDIQQQHQPEPWEELQQQNHELLMTLSELRCKRS